MGKRRNTAKTGDSAIYKSRQQQVQAPKKNRDEDDMYNEVDRFHNQREHEQYIRLDGGANGGSDEDDGITKQEAILDLGGVESSSESEDDSSDDDQSADSVAGSEQEGSEASSSESETDELGADEDNVRDWGRKKSAYYHGDTADLEIGQDEEDAFVEEEAAKEVLAARYAQMDEDDYALSDAEDEEKKEDKPIAELVSERDLSKLSAKERHRLLQSHHPEFLPLVSHFSQHITDWHERTSVAERALLQTEGGEAAAVGASQHGLKWLSTRALLQASSALNISMYLLLKAEHEATKGKDPQAMLGISDTDSSPINAHPVIARLQQLNKLCQKLEDRVDTKVEGLDEQLDNLVKASALMESGQQDEEDLSDQEEVTAISEGDLQIQDAGSEASDDEEEQEQPEELPSSDDEREKLLLLNDARFGLRMDELDGQEETPSRRNRKRRPVVASDFGDEQEDFASRRATQALASTVNAIEQRSSTKSRKRKAVPVAEGLDVPNDDDADGLRQGLEMMEAELGRLESDDDGGGRLDDELDGELEDDDDDFYSKIAKKSKDKKSFKRELYKVAPKYPGIDAEIEGERAVSRQILKNRGLVAHKSKLNRNPRVKKREQYRRALVRRKGAVREVRTNEGHKYGGEETGIKSGLSRSRKLARR